MPEPYVLRATCTILHLGIKAGDVVTWDSRGIATVTRVLSVQPGALAGCIADGTLIPADASDPALVARQLREA